MTKVLVSMDASLVRRLDDEARRQRLSRSALISRLVNEALGTRRSDEQLRRRREALARIDTIFAPYQGGPDAATAVREARDEA
jgi:metal-responsive CopG/Arc/MetJ family transcriptional regulator